MSTLSVGAITDGTNSVPSDTVIRGTIKTWANINGTGVIATRASFNVTSLTDNGVGDYTTNITAALADANFSVVGSSKRDALNEPGHTVPTVYTSSSIRVVTGGGSFTLFDSNFVNLALVR